MPRKPRQQSPTDVYHVINRGVNKKDLFHGPKDFLCYLGLVNEYKERLDIRIYHYCLMTNHAHMLVKSKDVGSLSQFMHFIQRRFAYYYCKTYQWTGQVFQRSFRSFPIDKESYFLECGRYIEKNPVRAAMVKSTEDYP